MPPKPADVVGIGLVTLDQIGVAPGSHDAVAELGTFSLQAGGPTGTALATVSALGGKARLFTRLGDDEFAQIILSRLQSFAIDTSAVLFDSGKMSPATFIFIEENTRRRYVRYTRGDTAPLGAADVPPAVLDGARLLYVDGEAPAAQIAAAERARAAGMTVLLDARRMAPGVGELLGLSNIVIASERVAGELSRSSDVGKTLLELTRMGADAAVVTMGDEGCVGLHGDKLVRQEAVAVEMVDRTGAGSVFRGAFAFAWIRGWPLERALPFANAAAALNCSSLGAQSGIPTADAVEHKLRAG